MTTWALLPVKPAPAVKSRLAPVLNGIQRAALMRWMIQRVLSAIAEVDELAGVLVVGQRLAGDSSLEMAWTPDPGGGANAATVHGFEQLHKRGVEAALYVAGDLPLLGGEDLRSMLTAGQACGMALATDRHGTGTNAMYQRLPARLIPTFGPGSLERHLHAARVLGHEPRVIDRPGLILDVDEAEDLELVRKLLPEVAAVLARAERRSPA